MASIGIQYIDNEATLTFDIVRVSQIEMVMCDSIFLFTTPPTDIPTVGTVLVGDGLSMRPCFGCDGLTVEHIFESDGLSMGPILESDGLKVARRGGDGKRET